MGISRATYADFYKPFFHDIVKVVGLRPFEGVPILDIMPVEICG
jgi:hypothetical protein